MAFTYDLTTNRGKVRFLIPDNDSAAYDLEDAEVDYCLTETGSNIIAAAVKACKQLSRKYAKRVSFSADGASFQMSQRAEVFAARARELELEMTGGFSTADLDREDGYSENATTGDYPSRTVYIKV